MPSPRMVPSSTVQRSGPTTFHPDRSLLLNNEIQPGLASACASSGAEARRTASTPYLHLNAEFLPRDASPLVDRLASHDCSSCSCRTDTDIGERLALLTNAGEEIGGCRILFAGTGGQQITRLSFSVNVVKGSRRMRHVHTSFFTEYRVPHAARERLQVPRMEADLAVVAVHVV